MGTSNGVSCSFFILVTDDVASDRMGGRHRRYRTWKANWLSLRTCSLHATMNKTLSSLRNDGGNKTRLHLFSASRVAGNFLISVYLRQC